MKTASVSYKGDLRTESVHLRSNTMIQTDAPVDNKGKGEKFSPTDLVASALASCILSIIGIYCNEHNIDFKNGKIDVEKIMTTDPRRIGAIVLDMDFKGNNWDENLMQKILKVAKTCPVAKSLDPNIEVTYKYEI